MEYILKSLVLVLVAQVAEGVIADTAKIAQGVQMEKSESDINTTATPEVYHFERDSPHNVSVPDISYKYMNVSWVMLENSTDILFFRIHYQRKRLMPDSPQCPQMNMLDLNVTASPNQTLFHGSIRGLEAGTKYYICVEAVYGSGHEPYSRILERQTLGCGSPGTAERFCECSSYGADPSNPCVGDTCQCNCKDKFFTGEKCDECVKGYYVHKALAGGRCEKCDCPEDRSDGTCSIQDSLVKCHCKDKYLGPRCKLCADKLYRTASGGCAPCKCNGNEHPDDHAMCDRTTGICTSCHYNTAGDYCEKCLDGYSGNPLNKTCTRDAVPESAPSGDAGMSVHYRRLHLATWAGVVVGVVGLLIMLATICFAVRWKRLARRRPLQLWTIQLQNNGDDHLNFSQLVDTAGDGEDDGDGGRQLFEKDHQPNVPSHRSSKSNIYKAVRT